MMNEPEFIWFQINLNNAFKILNSKLGKLFYDMYDYILSEIFI